MKRVLSMTLVLMIVFSPVRGQSDSIEIGTVSIEGTVVDNYVNLTYGIPVNNPSTTDKEMRIFVPVQSGLYLSNVSISFNDTVLWGRVYDIAKAQAIYNKTVDLNATGAIIYKVHGGYNVQMNLPGGTELKAVAFVEGLLTRRLGEYTLSILPKDIESSSQISAVNVDVTLTSNIVPLVGIRAGGIQNADYTALSNGYRVQYSGPISDDVSLSYALTKYEGDSAILGYNNGTDKFFSFFLAPELEESRTRALQVVFVIDKSGSMGGQKMEQAKKAFTDIIALLSSEDLFNIIAFSSTYQAYKTETVPGTLEEKEEAINWVDSITPGGSTNIYDSVVAAIDSFKDSTNEPAIILLSDGLPNSGTYVDGSEITANIAENNPKNIPISTIAFGDGADDSLMANIATATGGAFIKVDDNENAAGEILRFYTNVTGTTVHNWYLEYTGAKDINLPSVQSAFVNGSEVVITGRFDTSVEITAYVEYEAGNVTHFQKMNDARLGDHKHIEILWAVQKIQNADDPQEAVLVALEYGLVVEGLTAMVLTSVDEADKAVTETMPVADEAFVRQEGTGSLFGNAPFPPLAIVIGTLIIPAFLVRRKSN